MVRLSLLSNIRMYRYVAERFRYDFFNDILLRGYFNNTSSCNYADV